MFSTKSTRRGKRGAMLVGILLVLMLPFAALAQDMPNQAQGQQMPDQAQAQPMPNQPQGQPMANQPQGQPMPDPALTADAATHATAPNRNVGGGNARPGNNMRPQNAGPIFAGLEDTANLTDEQKIVYEQALALYEQVEDQVLADLVTAGAATQEQVDSYTALREARKSLLTLDESAWTAAQYKAYYAANALTGDERKQAMQALADAGQLTQAQADALGAQGENDLWATLNVNTTASDTVRQAHNILMQARDTMQQTLQGTGILPVNQR